MRICHNPRTCKIHGPERRAKKPAEDTFKVFQTVGRALYGDLWCAPFAELIGTRTEFLRTIALEPIPEPIWVRIDAALAAKIGDLRLAKDIVTSKRFSS
jgi:hypothetical protein